MRAWALSAMGDNRDFKGNDGYPDVPESYYVFDSTVQNSKLVGVGDLVVVRNREIALGTAWVEAVDVEPDVPKVRYRCPECKRIATKERKFEKPRYLCQRCRLLFDERESETITVTRYTARYGATWRGLDGALTVRQLRAIAENKSTQQAISPLRVTALQALLEATAAPLPPEVPADAPRELPAGRGEALVKVRKGQPAFRKALLQRDGLNCAITGKCPAEALQAAHLRAFAVHEKHDTAEGLLLRADIHVLFDRGLMAVNPTTLEVVIMPALRAYPAYRELEGLVLGVREVSREALRAHYKKTVGVD
ncbi:hypothetical protein APASM_6598 [Actinosynnema pretiosum subsp. pretiosum]|nr:hypothetical protein APASM_6598 [Actinosynnema pretiosum subsp. pretiosum]